MNINFHLRKIITVILLFVLLSVLHSKANPAQLAVHLSPFAKMENNSNKDSLKYIRINGKVISKDDGLPISGVKIKVKGTHIVTYSAEGGIFTVIIPDTTYHLVISLKGYKKKEVSFIKNGYHEIWLEDSEPIRDPVVVNPANEDQ